VEPGRANVVALVRGARRGPTLLLSGHLDTSWSGDPTFDYPGLGPPGADSLPRARVDGDAVLGLGAFNMKGGLAAAALALVELAGMPRLRGDVLFAGTCGESEKAPVPGAMVPRLGRAYRGRGVGARHFLRRRPRIDFAVVAGPSALRVVNAQAGSLFIEVAACGQPAYLGRRPAGGQAPVEVVASFLPELRAWGEAYRERHALDTGLGRLEPGLTIGAIEGGWPFAPSTSPAVCHLYLDLRVAPGQSSAQAIRELRECLGVLATRHPSIRIRTGIYARGRATMTASDHPLVRTAVDILERDLGLPAAPYGSGSADTSNDSNLFRQHGIASIKVGPSDRFDVDPASTATRGLHVNVRDLVVAQRLYVRLAQRLVSQGALA
jgi:acetylornithine deacetylase/succinyl-diaminopimelate desuccinylase-like protein